MILWRPPLSSLLSTAIVCYTFDLYSFRKLNQEMKIKSFSNENTFKRQTAETIQHERSPKAFSPSPFFIQHIKWKIISFSIPRINSKAYQLKYLWLSASNMYIRNESKRHTATAGALPRPAVQCIYVTPPLELIALYNLLITAGSRFRKSNESKSLKHTRYNVKRCTAYKGIGMCNSKRHHFLVAYTMSK